MFEYMVKQPRLRFRLADEPGTGKTIMTGMYLTEARRQGGIKGNGVIIPPAHLVSKWLRDLDRLFGIQADRITSEMARSPHQLHPEVDTWIVSVDLLTHNPDALRKVAGTDASWSLVVFDEAHRLIPHPNTSVPPSRSLPAPTICCCSPRPPEARSGTSAA